MLPGFQFKFTYMALRMLYSYVRVSFLGIAINIATISNEAAAAILRTILKATAIYCPKDNDCSNNVLIVYAVNIDIIAAIAANTECRYFILLRLLYRLFHIPIQDHRFYGSLGCLDN